jgi:hypothetical protein
MSEAKDWLREHWETEDRLWARFSGQPLDRYFAYLAAEGRRIAEELKLPTESPSPAEGKPVAS